MAEAEVITEELPQEQEVSVELDTPVTPEKVETKEPKQEEDSELVKRLKETARAEGIQEEARRQAALKVEEDKKFAAERTTWQQEQANLQARALQADMDSLTNALGAAQAERAAAITDLKRARAEGDTDAELEADERRINAVSSIRELEKTKLDYEAYIEEQKRAPQPQRQQPAPQQPTDPVEKAIVGLAPSAQAWFRQHPEYVTDARKNAKVKSLHFDALEAGHELLSPAYFEYVESHLGLRGHTNGQNGQQRVSGMTSVTREAPGMAPMNSGDGKVRLSLEEQAIAKAAKNSPNESDADAFKRYAKFKLELRQKKANGEVQ